jgi:hypothetical protein
MIKSPNCELTASYLTIQPFNHLTTTAYSGGCFYIQRLRLL